MTQTQNDACLRTDPIPSRDGAESSRGAPWTPRRLLLFGAATLAALVAACGYSGPGHAAPKETVLFSFRGMKGYSPAAGLLADGAGNLYGTTVSGGRRDVGEVFELSPPLTGEKAWTERVLFSFNRTDGSFPWAGLIADGAGNLYGTTATGGLSNYGLVFRLSPPAAGKTAWTEKVLFSFNGTDGAQPLAGLIMDGGGIIYGTTEAGGPTSGVVFKLSPPVSGQTVWTETVLQSFGGLPGSNPSAGLIADGAGNLYGTTYVGGSINNDGAVFKLSPPTAGGTAWVEKVLYHFSGTDGALPPAGLIADAAGNLFGTTSGGGLGNDGVVFELSPPTAGETAWSESVLLYFEGTNGAQPRAGLIMDGAGDLYGTTQAGGANGYGEVFELKPPAAGKAAWTEKVLHSFNGAKGANPYAGLIADGAGNLYGTTESGGALEGGLVFKITP